MAISVQDLVRKGSENAIINSLRTKLHGLPNFCGFLREAYRHSEMVSFVKQSRQRIVLSNYMCVKRC